MIATSEPDKLRLIGRSMAPGLARGRAFLYRGPGDALDEEHPIRPDQVEAEFHRIEQAIKKVREDLRDSARRVEAQWDAQLAGIFNAHEQILQDPGLVEELREEMAKDLVSAERVVARIFRNRERKFRALGESVGRLADDLTDLERRLLRELSGVQMSVLEKIPPGSVLVAARLLPSETVCLPRGAVMGIVVGAGGLKSHAALLARAQGIPAVAGLAGVLEQIHDGNEVVVNGDRGEVVVQPGVATLLQVAEDLRQRQALLAHARARCREPAVSLDGVAITVRANIGGREDAEDAALNGADGVGLYRIEQFYLRRNVPPTEDELFEELSGASKLFAGKPVTIRLLDLGADKQPPMLKLPGEDNPALGLRGVRLLLKYPQLAEVQSRCLLRLARQHDVRILVPMVTLASDMIRIREILQDMSRKTGCAAVPPLGAMIETPAAALCVGAIASHSDFLSLGTNDLTQYTMAAGRENLYLGEYYNEEHPAILRLIRMVIAEAGGKPVEICGRLAARVAAVPLLLGLGIRHLSVGPPFVPWVKEAVRRSTAR